MVFTYSSDTLIHMEKTTHTSPECSLSKGASTQEERAATGTGRRPTWRVRRRRAQENDALAFPHGHRASRPAAEVAQICERNTALRCEARRSLKTHCSCNVSLLFYHYLSKVSFSLSSSERKVLTINLYHPVLNACFSDCLHS